MIKCFYQWQRYRICAMSTNKRPLSHIFSPQRFLLLLFYLFCDGIQMPQRCAAVALLAFMSPVSFWHTFLFFHWHVFFSSHAFMNLLLLTRHQALSETKCFIFFFSFSFVKMHDNEPNITMTLAFALFSLNTLLTYIHFFFCLFFFFFFFLCVIYTHSSFTLLFTN